VSDRAKNIVIVGAQWGDEGKGKIIDILSQEADYIVRYQGGSNAGHTVVADGEAFVFHLIPSGILHRDKTCCIGNGVTIDPESLLHELDTLRDARIPVAGRLKISALAHVIMPYHRPVHRPLLRGQDKPLRHPHDRPVEPRCLEGKARGQLARKKRDLQKSLRPSGFPDGARVRAVPCLRQAA